MIDTILLSVVIALLVIDRIVSRVSSASQREEHLSTFREGGRAYIDGYKLAFREFKKRDGEDE